MNLRIYVEKHSNFATESNEIKERLKNDKKVETNVRYIKFYDVFDTTQEELDFLVSDIVATSNKDIVTYDFDLNANYLASQLLPGSFDNRAVSALDCLKIRFDTKCRIYSGEVFVFDDNVDTEEIKDYLINPIERQVMTLDEFVENNNYLKTDDYIHEGFCDLTSDELVQYIKDKDMSLELADLLWIQDYFKNKENRNPTNLEISMLETYWSDHCRHTTFETFLMNVEIADGYITDTYNNYLTMREELNSKREVSLMDLASIYGKYVVINNIKPEIEVSSEVNACSVYVDVDVDGETQEWLMMFKNETHNHPTEIEPFGGAATCIGGAIRDPLSGRSYVYQAMRISGSANPLEDDAKTLEHKLSQAKISKISAQGNSSYGNQIGLTTSYVKEIFDLGYKAKHMELGAVVGATKASDVVRLEPSVGDLIILVGGKTGKDGIGGASGSSKEHTADTLASKMAEVQKGNPVEERKLQRLFKKSEVSRLIKKSNDFGAGGVSVAIGEIADSIRIDLSKIPLKYSGLSSYEIALSESQERMAVCLDPNDVDTFIKYANEENLDAVVVAVVTDSNYLEMEYEGKIIVSLAREFLDTNGATRSQDVTIAKTNPINLDFSQDLKQTFSDKNAASQFGLQRMFDSTIGGATVLAPFGGKYLKTPTDVSVIKFPVETNTKTASALAYGYFPQISKQNEYIGAMQANVSAIAKLIACGCDLENIKFTYQEYFNRLGTDPLKWGSPLASLLGAFKVQQALNLPSIGGKDSMSGTFKDIDVPPTLVAFAINTIDVDHVVSSEFKSTESHLYMTDITVDENLEYDFKRLKATYSKINQLVLEGKISAMKAVDIYGPAKAIAEMSFGNKIGVVVDTDINLYQANVGQIIIESTHQLEGFIKLGHTTTEQRLALNEQAYQIDELVEISEAVFEPLYQTKVSRPDKKMVDATASSDITYNFPTPKSNVSVLIPVFPGTNCEYDMQRVFTNLGCEVKQFVINNLSSTKLNASIDEFAQLIKQTDILVFSGGFSLGDEPDGSGKFIANIIKAPSVKQAIEQHLDAKKLVIGICNGFQGLIESGLLPFKEIKTLDADAPVLFRNDLNEHISEIVNVKITSNKSPWLSSHQVGSVFNLPISHGEGRFICNDETLKRLIDNKQIFSQYVNLDGEVVNDSKYNLNGSTNAIEGLISECGLVIGKMGHNERVTYGTLKNTVGNYDIELFKNAVDYIKGEK